MCVCVEGVCLVLGLSLGNDWGMCSVYMASCEPRGGEPCSLDGCVLYVFIVQTPCS